MKLTSGVPGYGLTVFNRTVDFAVLVLVDNLGGCGYLGASLRGGSRSGAPLDDEERQSPNSVG